MTKEVNKKQKKAYGRPAVKKYNIKGLKAGWDFEGSISIAISCLSCCSVGGPAAGG